MGGRGKNRVGSVKAGYKTGDLERNGEKEMKGETWKKYYQSVGVSKALLGLCI